LGAVSVHFTAFRVSTSYFELRYDLTGTPKDVYYSNVQLLDAGGHYVTPVDFVDLRSSIPGATGLDPVDGPPATYHLSDLYERGAARTYLLVLTGPAGDRIQYTIKLPPP
jgi:hypothetical protein